MAEIIRLEDRFPSRRKTLDQIVGRRLIKFREGSGESRAEIAYIIGSTEQQVELWECGYSRIPAFKLYWLSRHFDVALAAFFDLVD